MSIVFLQNCPYKTIKLKRSIRGRAFCGAPRRFAQGSGVRRKRYAPPRTPLRWSARAGNERANLSENGFAVIGVAFGLIKGRGSKLLSPVGLL